MAVVKFSMSCEKDSFYRLELIRKYFYEYRSNIVEKMINDEFNKMLDNNEEFVLFVERRKL